MIISQNPSFGVAINKAMNKIKSQIFVLILRNYSYYAFIP